MGGPIDFGWIVFYATWGAAALHPSMRDLTEPRVVHESDVTTARMVILTLSALIAPIVLVIEEVRGTVHDSIAIAALSALVFLLVLLRLAGVVRTNRQATERERGLREAGAILVSATDVETVRDTVRRRGGPPAADRQTARGRPHACGPTSVHDGPSTLDGEQRFVRVADLPAAVATELDNFEIALVNPLMVADRVAGHPLVGTLFVAADEADLGALQGSLPRCSPPRRRWPRTDHAQRRDRPPHSEEYFRTLVHNTADVILIVDDDDRIRYASPSAHTHVRRHAADRPGWSRDLVDPANRELAQQLLDLVRVAGQRPPRARLDRARAGRRPGRRSRSRAATCAHDPTVGGLVVTLRDVTEQRRLRARAQPPGLPRRADRAGQPGLFTEPGRSRRSAGPGPATDRRGALHRPGRLQGGQRHHGPRDRRPAAGRGRRAADRGRAAPAGHRRPPRRRRVRRAGRGRRRSGRRGARSPSGSSQRWPSRSCSAAACSSAPRPASASPPRRTPPTRRSCCARPTSRCTWPRTPARAAGGATSPALHTRGGRAAGSCAPTWTRRSSPATFVLRYQPIVTLADAATRSASRRWCAGPHPTRGHARARRVHRRGRGDRADRPDRRLGAAAARCRTRPPVARIHPRRERALPVSVNVSARQFRDARLRRPRPRGARRGRACRRAADAGDHREPAAARRRTGLGRPERAARRRRSGSPSTTSAPATRR